ncbi:MAG: UPF0175 family protein [Desulfurococcales archaeon]|nr:UPF0175 family protein [Desulfurococcales archaeon]
MAEKGAASLRKVNVSRFMEKLRRAVEDLGIVEPIEWVLALLHAFGGEAPSKLHIQKALFVASRYIDGLRETLEFKAYRMGPWSEEINDVVENAILSGLLTPSENGIALTFRGVAKARSVWKKLSDRDKEVLARVASLLSRMSEDELLLYIYTLYGYSEKSDVVTKLLRRRKELALSMLRKGLVSVGLAAKMAGMTVQDFVKYLRRRGVKPFVAEVNDIEEAEKL